MYSNPKCILPCYLNYYLNASVLTKLHLYVLLHLSMIIIVIIIIVIIIIIIVIIIIIHQTYGALFKDLKDAL